MTSKSKQSSLKELDSILQEVLEFKSDDEKLQFEAEALHLDTMGVIEHLMKSRSFNKKDLADELDTSQSYITQLFTASKLINYKTLAKIQRIFNIKFTVDYKSIDNLDINNTGDIILNDPKIIPINRSQSFNNSEFNFREKSTINSEETISINQKIDLTPAANLS